MLIRGLPNGVRHTHPQTGRESPVAINRNGWSQSIGNTGRDRPECPAHLSEAGAGEARGQQPTPRRRLAIRRRLN